MAAYKMSKLERFLLMRCLIFNFIIFTLFNIRMLLLVAKGHGGTRD